MEKGRTIVVDLHAHPHFYSLSDNPHGPSLLEIVEHRFKNSIHIAALSGCSAQAGKFDTRFREYMEQRGTLDKAGYSHDLREGGRWLTVYDLNQRTGKIPKIILLNSQEVRTDYKTMPADINIIGVRELLDAGESLDDTAMRAMDLGGIVSICHPMSQCGAGIDKALGMKLRGAVDAIECSSAITPLIEYEMMKPLLEKAGVPNHTVSDAHHYRQTARSYDAFSEGVYYDFSLENLREQLREGAFDSVQGTLTPWEAFSTHTWHIVKSIPGHLLKNPDYILKALVKRKQ